MPGSVDAGAFADLLRHGLEIAHHDDEIVHADGSHQDDRPLAAHQPQVLDGQVLGDGSGIKEHHDDEKDHDAALEQELGPGERVGGHGGEKNVDRGADKGDLYRVPQRGDDGGVGENHLVVDQGKAVRDDAKAAHVRALHRIGKGVGDDVEQRNEHGDRQTQHKDRQHDLPGGKGPPSGKRLFFHWCCPSFTRRLRR